MSIKTTSRQLVGKQTVKTSAVANSSTATAAATIVYDGEFDPFLNTVALHVTGVPEYTDHILKDKSSIMNKKHSLNLGGLVCLIAAVFFICYLLREGDIFPISIDFVWFHISHWAKHFSFNSN